MICFWLLLLFNGYQLIKLTSVATAKFMQLMFSLKIIEGS